MLRLSVMRKLEVKNIQDTKRGVESLLTGSRSGGLSTDGAMLRPKLVCVARRFEDHVIRVQNSSLG
jgi:hypothetical protein